MFWPDPEEDSTEILLLGPAFFVCRDRQHAWKTSRLSSAIVNIYERLRLVYFFRMRYGSNANSAKDGSGSCHEKTDSVAVFLIDFQ